MYNDDEEEDDEEMIDLHYQQPHNDIEENTLNDDNSMATEAEAATDCRNSTPKELLRPLTRQKQGGAINLETKRSNGRGRLAIVDYGRDEFAMSPEPEEGEFEDKLQSANGVIQEKSSSGTAHVLSPSVQATPESFENLGPSQPGEINDTTNESEAVNTEGANEVPAEGVNPLDKFLPPPPKEKCPEELQAKADMRRERERKDQELKRSPKVEFVPGITRPGVVVPPTKFSMPIPAVTASGMRPSSNAAPCEVDDDGRNLLTGGQDSFAAAAAQAALISAANLGRQAAETARQKIKDPEKGS